MLSFDVLLNPDKENGLKTPSKLKLRQIRVIDKSRLVEKLGSTKKKEIHQKLFHALRLLFDFEQLYA